MPLSEKVKMALLLGTKTSPSTFWWLLTKSPKLLRRGFQLALVYFLSQIAKVLLDLAHKAYPENEFLSKADTVANAALSAENYLVFGATSLVKSAYDEIPTNTKDATSAHPLPLAPLALVEADTTHNNADIIIPQIKAEDLKPPSLDPRTIPGTEPGIEKVASIPLAQVGTAREAAFMPPAPLPLAPLPLITPGRSRANLNSELATPLEYTPEPPRLAPDGLPFEGGYEASTGITWHAYKDNSEVLKMDGITMR